MEKKFYEELLDSLQKTVELMKKVEQVYNNNEETSKLFLASINDLQHEIELSETDGREVELLGK